MLALAGCRSRPVGILLLIAMLLSLAVHAAEPVQLWEEADLRLRPGVSAQVVVRLSVAEGYRLVGAGVQHAQLKGLALRMQPTPGVRFQAPRYPRPQPAPLLAGAPPVPAHEGVIAIRLPVVVAPGTKWRTSMLRGTLQYQACRAGRCEAVRALPVAIEVELLAAQAAKPQGKP
ncbi:MAG: hypothetical protein KIS79_04500 [Burkholderiales bacterium]|nr:hypothetical protein [Burkholderiales bacterium]